MTFLKHGSQYATELPAFQPMTVSPFLEMEQGMQKYSLHFKQVYFVVLGKRNNIALLSPPLFSKVIFYAWQLPKN